MMAFVIGALIFYRWWREERCINDMHWKIRYKELDFDLRKKKSDLRKRKDKSKTPQMKEPSGEEKEDSCTHASFEPIKEISPIFHQYTTVASYNGNIVAIKKIWKHRLRTDRKLLFHVKELLVLKHRNLTTFVGICQENKSISVLWEYCSRGSLSDILDNPDKKVNSMFQISIAFDICTGLEYLHNSPLKYHGNLTSSNCVVDSRWLCKLTDFGLRPIRKGEDNTSDQLSEDDKAAKLFWLAPELLRPYLSEKTSTPTPQGDIFAFGIILKEILCLNKPYTEEKKLTPNEIVTQVAHSKNKEKDKDKDEEKLMRPVILQTQDDYPGLRQPFYHLAQACWAEDPQRRPPCKRVLKKLTRLNPYMSSSMLENMAMMMEPYSKDLEKLMTERTIKLEDNNSQTDALLYSLLPRKIADNLKVGQSTPTEVFDSMSVCFSDIVGFTDLACESTPAELVEMLDTLYAVLDDSIKHFDVYKVETTGDANMIVSGVPVANGDQHAMEMADAALCLLKAVFSYQIPHRPGIQLKIRIGIHSGPVVAGVVDLTMPRYCLFGDTVNTAARMESNGMPLKIHLSPTTAGHLKTHPLYNVTDRGVVDIKGKGKMSTSWLQGKMGLFTLPTDDIAKTSQYSDVTGSRVETDS